jgi:hypothetical protein
MKKTFIFAALAALFAFSSVASAEVPGHRERKIEHKREKIHHKRMKMHERRREMRHERRMHEM